MLFIEYPKCSTCQKAKKWLDENGFEYESRHIKVIHRITAKTAEQNVRRFLLFYQILLIILYFLFFCLTFFCLKTVICYHSYSD